MYSSVVADTKHGHLEESKLIDLRMVTIEDEIDIEMIPAGTQVHVHGILTADPIDTLILKCSCIIEGKNRLCNIYANNLRLDY